MPVGIVALPLALYALPASFVARRRVDLLGVVLAALGVPGIVYGVVNGSTAGWTSLEVLGTLALGAVLLLAFVLWERRVANPLLPPRLFRDRSFSVANIVGLVFSFGIFGAVFILTRYLQVVAGATPLEAGLMTTPWTLAPLVVAPLTGLLAPRVGTRALIVVGCLLQCAAVTWLALTMSRQLDYPLFLPAFLCGGIGMGLVFAPISTATLATMTAADNAKASGTNATVREIGVALGVAVMTSVFLGAGGTFTQTGYVHAAVPAIAVGAGVLLLAAVAALFLPPGRAPVSVEASAALAAGARRG